MRLFIIGFIGIFLFSGCLAKPAAINAPTPVSAKPTNQVRTYYVSAGLGSDNNPGSQNHPWKTIQKAANMIRPGETAVVEAGTYLERVKVTRSGASTAPVTYQADGQVITNGFTVKADYITIKGFEITDTPNDDTDGMGIYVSGNFCDLENNYVHYATRGGIYLELGANSCKIINNKLERNSQFGIDVHGNNSVIENNEIWGTIQYHPKWINPPSFVDADGIHFFGSGHLFRGNYIHDISLSQPENTNPHIDAFQTWDGKAEGPAGSNSIFEQNKIVLGDGTTGFQLEGGTHDLVIRNNIIEAFVGVNAHKNSSTPFTIPANLFILNNDWIGDLNYNRSEYPAGISFENTVNSMIHNNIFAEQRDQIIFLKNSAGIDSDYNLAYNSDSSMPEGPFNIHDLWGVNPLFTNLQSGDYHLQAGSPAIEAGEADSKVTNDYESNPRLPGRGYDIGAYEYMGP